MSTSRSVFIDRINSLKLSFANSALADEMPTTATVDHNNVAKLLRNGMAIIGFVTLEDFIISRTKEALTELSTYNISFNNLPQDLRFRTTVQALTALTRLASFEFTKDDKILFIQNATQKIASTLNSSYSLIDIAFGHHSSNINEAEIKSILKAYKIDNPWDQMTNISSRIGLTAFPLDNSFKNAALRRHRAAHTVNANTPLIDLTGYVKEAIGIAIAFDCLTSAALRLFKTHNTDYINGTRKIDAATVSLSYVKKEGTKWKYKRECNTAATKTNTDKAITEAFARTKASTHFETLIIHNSINEVENWICFY